MGHLRINELALNDVVDEASYAKYDLSEAGKLSAILLKVGEKVTTNLIQTETKVPAHITKLEVMGKRDKTIKSYRGLDCQALHAYQFGQLPPHTDRMPTGEFNYEEFLIRFGRYVGDPLLYLDLDKDPDVDLKITNDFDVTTYWTDGELKYTIHEIFLPPETPPEQGYLRDYEHSYWAAVNGATESKKLTPGFKVFKVLLRGVPDINATWGYCETNTYNLLREISVDFLNKTEVAIDAMETRDLMYLLSQMYGGPWHNRGEGYVGISGHAIETFLGYRVGMNLVEDESASASTFMGYYFDPVEGRAQVYATAGQKFSWSAMGVLPYYAIILPFDIGWPGVPLLDTEAKKPVYIRVHSHSSSGDNYMCVEELGKL